ncbi:hypothetical protein HYS47_03100 [Candidatus Woesearchaeota archaeon]|nr:hypothetical protein [Candidatus Woesearchaeota archaeon]
MAQIIEIGTYHDDQEGPSRLERTLTELTPDIVICEGFQGKLDGHAKYIEMLTKALTKSVALRSKAKKAKARKWLDYERTASYEGRVSKGYCALAGKRFIWFNDAGKMVSDEERALNVQRAVAFFGKEDPDRIMRVMSTQAHRLYHALNLAFNSSDPSPEIILADRVPNYYSNSMVGPRDEHMANALKLIVNENPDTRIVAVVGYFHLLRDPRQLSFYQRTSELNPERRLIA